MIGNIAINQMAIYVMVGKFYRLHLSTRLIANAGYVKSNSCITYNSRH